MDTVNEVNELVKVLTSEPKLLVNLNTSISRIFRLANHLLNKGVKIPVLCKDCKHCMLCYPEKQIDKEATPGWYCKDQKKYRRPDDFCSYGERKDNDNQN